MSPFKKGAIKMGRKSRTITGIDIGSMKISTVVAEASMDGIDIIGYGVQPSHGVKKGVVVNMESTIDSLKSSIDKAETMSGITIDSAVVGISGTHVEGLKSSGVIPIGSKEIKQNDIDKVMENAKAIIIPMDREVLHIIPKEFIVDGNSGIKDPMGMTGVRLETNVYIITGPVSTAQNIMRCINKADIKVQDIILNQLASAEAVLTEDEKELGCVVIDIGAGTADIAVYYKGSIHHCAVVPIGGELITSDIAIGIRTPISEAEEIKKNIGNLDESSSRTGNIEVCGIGDKTKRMVQKNTINQIIEARVDEIFSLIKKELETSGWINLLPAGVVLTGGTSMLKGINTTASKILGMPVRTGVPDVRGITDVINPMYSTAIGMAMYLIKGYTIHDVNLSESKNPLSSIGGKIKKWFSDAF